MYVSVSQTNKSTGAKREWVFLIKLDYSQLNLAKSNNQIVFSRFAQYDKKGKPVKTYDTDSSNPNTNCAWKEAKPSDKIIDKAVKKLIDSWTVSVKKSR